MRKRSPARARRTCRPPGGGRPTPGGLRAAAVSSGPARPTASAGRSPSASRGWRRHHRAVAELAGTSPAASACTASELHAVVRAAELHDVGKVLVPDTILDKPGELSEDELELMRRHAIAGWLILHESAEPDAVATAGALLARALGRHGLPRRLAGDAIPLGARIITICDAFDAMTHERPTGQARSAPRPSRSCARAPACATTRRWSPSSSRPSRRRPTGRRA